MARKADNTAMLIFTMPLDSDKCVIPNLNRGRLALVDRFGLIGRWVCTSSYNGKQNFNDWNVRGGVIPPTSSMKDNKHWEFHTKRLSQPGAFVDDGYLITFNGSTAYTTNEGTTRSEIMVHDDTNRLKNPGSAGCIVTMATDEYNDFNKVIKESVSQLPVIPLFVIYCF